MKAKPALFMKAKPAISSPPHRMFISTIYLIANYSIGKLASFKSTRNLKLEND
jgi:hypothetical protein